MSNEIIERPEDSLAMYEPEVRVARVSPAAVGFNAHAVIGHLAQYANLANIAGAIKKGTQYVVQVPTHLQAALDSGKYTMLHGKESGKTWATIVEKLPSGKNKFIDNCPIVEEAFYHGNPLQDASISLANLQMQQQMAALAQLVGETYEAILRVESGQKADRIGQLVAGRDGIVHALKMKDPERREQQIVAARQSLLEAQGKLGEVLRQKVASFKGVPRLAVARFAMEVVQSGYMDKRDDEYSDSISGLSAEKRPEFMRMIEDAMAGKIDYILCKSVSRFSRNVTECKKYTDMLRTKNVTVEFEKEHLRTDDPTSSFVFSLMSAIAENESRSISENVKWSYHKRFAEGQYCIGSNQMLGYDLDKGKGKLVPNKDAWIIRLIFRRLVEGATFQSIINELTEKKVTRMRSKAAWNVSSLLGILRNETYVGDKLLQKKPPLNFLTKRPDLTLDYDSYYLENDHEAIIDRETWEKAQERLDQCRQEKENGVHRRRADHHVFYGKLFCGECGGTYKRRTFSVKEADGVRHYHAWNCRERQKGKNGNGCKNITLQEKVLEDMITAEMGWSEFNDERFETEIQRVEVTPSGIRVLRKVA